MDNKDFLPYEAFDNKQRRCNPLEKEYLDYETLIYSVSMTVSALAKTKLCEKLHTTGAENYFYLLKLWEQEKMQSIKDFLRWYNNKDIVPTLEAMQKLFEFYHNKVIMLEACCTLPEWNNICLYSSSSAKFTYSQKSKNICFQKIVKMWSEAHQ